MCTKTNLETALIYCRQLEQHAPTFGLHIGLTGGCLYKDGDRKDLDIILYRIRQEPEPNLEDFYLILEEMGWEMGKNHGWVQKMKTPVGDNVDFFYPERTQTEDEEEYRG